MARVLVPLAQGCEELEAITVVDLLRRAGIQVVTAGLDGLPVKASRGSVLIPDVSLDSIESDFDMIVLPGGLPGADNLNADERIHRILQKMASEAKFICAICAAPKVLATAGLLNNKKATSFPGSLDGCEIVDFTYLEESVVIDGNIVTSRGPGTAMDFALELIELLEGKAVRDQVEAPLQRPLLRP
ncbi:MAG: DJ-1/PfpI family protein [Gammaproteobacteria bacterium]|nr:DJ-1/PfpI family protein [Gammaproteobacteria bacterium]